MNEIRDLEIKYKDLLAQRLKKDERLDISCPYFEYPAPVYVYAKCKNNEKSIAVRIDGGDKTMRFWDYVDDDYSDEDGVWDEMSEEGLERFVTKLYDIMNRAVDVEFYDAAGEVDDYFSGVFKMELSEDNARKAVKKIGKNKPFAFAKVSDFFGEKLFVFDRALRSVKK